ncbi:MAG: sporulation protein YabP [Oscillospiraceae bacterium]
MQKKAELPRDITHNIIMENRRELRISGVKDIDSFSETRVVLSTVMGELVIKGQELHISALEAETGEFSMSGQIKSLCYNSFSSSDSLFGRMFR